MDKLTIEEVVLFVATQLKWVFAAAVVIGIFIMVGDILRLGV